MIRIRNINAFHPPQQAIGGIAPYYQCITISACGSDPCKSSGYSGRIIQTRSKSSGFFYTEHPPTYHGHFVDWPALVGSRLNDDLIFHRQIVFHFYHNHQLLSRLNLQVVQRDGLVTDMADFDGLTTYWNATQCKISFPI